MVIITSRRHGLQAVETGTALSNIEEGQIVKIADNGTLYRVVQAVTPIKSQPPHGEGMLAIYRPIDEGHAGTQGDPIPWVYGMDCRTGSYYSYSGVTYLCKGDMLPCVWYPDSGIWQWEVADE